MYKIPKTAYSKIAILSISEFGRDILNPLICAESKRSVFLDIEQADRNKIIEFLSSLLIEKCIGDDGEITEDGILIDSLIGKMNPYSI